MAIGLFVAPLQNANYSIVSQAYDHGWNDGTAVLFWETRKRRHWQSPNLFITLIFTRQNLRHDILATEMSLEKEV